MNTLRTRRPTCRASWPLILLAGEAKTGKTWSAVEFTGDPRVGRSFMLDLGEGSADEYGAVPGADYEIIDHDGTWVDIIGQVEAVRDVARSELAAGNPPVCLIVDSMTAEWGMLTAWTDARARRSRSNKALLAEDPDAEIDITSNYWNDANSRHNRLMNILKTFPGIVVMTTLETEKTQFGPNGRPIAGAPKVARPDGQKRLTADATVWVRLSLDAAPTIVGIRSLKHNITPGKDHPEPWPDFTLSKLVFEFMGLGGENTQVRDVPVLDADQVAPGEEVEAPPSGPRAVRTAEKNTELAKAGTAKMLAAGMAPEAAELRKRAESDPCGQVDIREFLGEDHREALGIDPDVASLTLAQLGELVTSYVERHGRSVNTALDAPAATPADSAQDAVTDSPTPGKVA